MLMIIGLTGNIGAGKGSVADILAEEGFEFHSLSDVIRDEIKSRGEDITRENLTKTAKELRNQGGPGILAKKLIQKLDQDKNIIVDSVRHPKEAKILRENLADFILVNVTAPIEICLKRIIARNRENDPKTIEELKTQLDKENNDNNQQLDKTAKLANMTIINDSSLDELKDKVLELLE